MRPTKGRGALGDPAIRFAEQTREAFDDGWSPGEALAALPEQVLVRDASRSIIARNQSPDVPFEQSINPYRGCEHGCIYCFARPSHAYLGYSPGLQFETHLHYKPEAASLLREALAKPGYRCSPIALGVNTDAYQPLERRLGLSRELLRVMLEHRQPVSIITKSALIERDLDLLRELAEHSLVQVMLSITTLDKRLARRMEPRAAAPARRLQTLQRLREAGVPTGVLIAPLIPFINDHELEDLLAQVHEAGAQDAGYVLLRLPLELADLFEQWLQAHYPERAQRVMQRIADCRGGRANDSRFGVRMRGEGVFADLLAKRFRKARQKLNFVGLPSLDSSGFRRPKAEQAQLDLF